MIDNVPLLLFVGLCFTSQILQCQSQGPGDGFGNEPQGMLSLDNEIAKFESQVANGGSETHAAVVGNAHSHAGTGPAMASGVSGRHSHHVNHVEVHDKKISDVHGNQPPHPGGLHVDLPFEHGNNKPFPVLHQGSAPITNDGPGHGGHDAHGDPNVGLPAMLGPPTLDELVGPSGGMALTDGIQSGAPPQAVPKHLAPAPVPPPANSFVSVLDGPGLQISDGIASGPVDLHALEHERGMHTGVHIDPPHTEGNNLPFPVIHRPGGHGSTNLGAQHIGTHVDPPGVHNNNMNVPVIHRPGPGGHAPPPHTGHGGGIHVDQPGMHGNNMPVPVIHRPGMDHPMPPGGPVNPGAHVDHPGMHGNNLAVPVIHRPVIGQPHPPPHTGIHVDQPGMHGNNMAVPVVHRPPGGIGPHMPPGHGGGAHVDQPGMHGNNMPVPVVHRPAGGMGPPGHGGGAHVDHPGMHGNNMPVPVVHRPSGIGHPVPNVHPAAGIGPPISAGPIGVHVDHAGVHGKNLPVPVIHRPQGIGSPIHPVGNIHVNTGIHGNNLPVQGFKPPTGIVTPFGPVSDIHGKRPGIHGKPPGMHPGHGGGIHIDMPGEHGNPHNEPAVHLPDGANIHDAVAAGVIPHGGPHPKHDIHDPGMLMPKPMMPIGVPKGAGNIPIVPSIADERRAIRKLQKKAQRKAIRKAQRKAHRNGGLLDDVIGRSKAINDHIHPEPMKPKQGVLVIRRSRPPVTSMLSTILGSLMSPRRIGPRPMSVRLGPPLLPPPPQGDPLQTVANSLVGMLMNGLASG